mgnify:CR=1 FL=1
MPPSSLPSRLSVTALRNATSSAATLLLFTTNMGLEDVVVDEWGERASVAGLAVGTGTASPFDLNSYALVSTTAPLSEVLPVARQMRSVHHVREPLYTFSLPDANPLDSIRDVLASVEVPEMVEAATFRVTTVRNGEHDFTSIDVQRVSGTGLQRQYDTEVDLENYDLDVHVDIHNDRGLISIQHTREALSRRQQRVFTPHAGLKTNVAYGLLRLPHLEAPPSVVLDPFCGSGTILIEAAAEWPDATLYGHDWDETVVEGVRANVDAEGLTGRITIREGDVWHLAETFDDLRGAVDLMVTNPPYGQRMGSSMDFFPFYRRVLEQTAAVLAPGGYLVLLVLRNRPFNDALDATDAYDPRHVRVLGTGGLYPRAFVLQKR